MIRLAIVLWLSGCSTPAVETWKAEQHKFPNGTILITPDPPKPKTFIEKTWPGWQKPWPSNRVPTQTPFRTEPLQVV